MTITVKSFEPRTALADKPYHWLPLIIALCLCCSVSAQSQRQPTRFQFLAVGDAPYNPKQEKTFRELLKQSEKEPFRFLVHVGDFKAGATPCTDEVFGKVRDMFRSYPKPVVFTPGDNEWTDCYTSKSDPIERLDRLRSMFFRDKSVLRLDQLRSEHQSSIAAFKRFVENYQFQYEGVHFSVVHVVGSGNNYRKGNSAALKEFAEREKATTDMLNRSFAQAVSKSAKALVIIIHANPKFELPEVPGFAKFKQDLAAGVSRFNRPTLLIHGDSHYFRIDMPLKSEDRATITRFTRMEVFGSPNVAGVRVSVDSSDPQVFQFRPYYLRSR